MIHKAVSDHSSGNISCSTVCINMVGTVLCIIFNDKDCAFIPYRTFTQVFNEESNRKIIVCNCGKRCGAAYS